MQQKVLQDCEQMIPSSQQRLEEAYDALKDLVVRLIAAIILVARSVTVIGGIDNENVGLLLRARPGTTASLTVHRNISQQNSSSRAQRYPNPIE